MQDKKVKIAIDNGGFEFDFNPDVLDDVEILDQFGEIQENPLAITKFVKGLLGDELYKDVKEYYAKKNGRMRITELTNLVGAIFEKFPKA